MQGGDLCDLQYYWDCNISVVFPTLELNVAKIIDYIEKASNESSAELNFLQKNSVAADLCLPQEWSLRATNIRRVLELKSRLFWNWRLPKLSIVLKIASNKSCIKLNFQQKTQWVYVFISSSPPRVELGGTKNLPFLKLCPEIRK